MSSPQTFFYFFTTKMHRQASFHCLFVSEKRQNGIFIPLAKTLLYWGQIGVYGQPNELHPTKQELRALP